MAITVRVYQNGDHACLVWRPANDQPLPTSRGFVVRRLRNGQETYLHGFAGFSSSDTPDPHATPLANALKFPIQRFLWWDYGAHPGDVVQYSVIPIVGPDKDHLQLDPAKASDLTPPLTIGAQMSPHVSALFNKGIVAAQWVSRALDAQPKGAKLKTIVAQPGNPVRNALSGFLRPQLLQLLADAKTKNWKVFAALYELDDPELIPALTALGKDCNLILANGAFDSNTSPDNDENADVRTTLKSQINLSDRIVKLGHFGHNKFVVFCDAAGQPQGVLTGSTNWTTSGLCTQANNALVVWDAAVAGAYLDYWRRIQAAGDAYPASYVQANSSANTFPVDSCRITPWCVPTCDAQDLAFARKLISAAQQGILFLFFNPGVFEPDSAPQKWTLLQNILFRHQPGSPDFNPNLYIRGVVNQDIAGLTKTAAARQAGQLHPALLDPTAPPPAALYTGGNQPPQRLGHDVLVPRNIKQQFEEFEDEQLGASLVNIHSKVIVLDPFGANPVVMTGSHNLGFKASSANDDNLIIIEGNAPLAAAYAVNIIAIFDNYRWNSYVEANHRDPKVWHGPVDNDQWQTGHLAGDSLQELNFWFGQTPAAPPK
jgi:phosphatidylserine/phosphatidylglycerophosphate/cardiolipin synthase-like enzyme